MACKTRVLTQVNADQNRDLNDKKDGGQSVPVGDFMRL